MLPTSSATVNKNAAETMTIQNFFFWGTGSETALDADPYPERFESASNANAKSEADSKRRSGLFSRQRWTTRSSAGGIPDTTCEIPGGSSFRTALIASAEVHL